MAFLAAAIQLSATPDRDHNLSRALALLGEAASRGARLLALPEMWERIGPASSLSAAPQEAAMGAFAGPLDGAQLAPLREFAARHSVWLHAGSVAERADDGRYHNTTALIDPSGTIAAHYRKLHLFDVDIPDGVRYRESRQVAPGAEVAPVVLLGDLGVRLGLSICYDLRFPELYRRLAENGADLLAIPAAFTAYTGKAHWEVLLRARAIENLAYVLAPAQGGQIGPESEKRFAYGHALIIDPWGEKLAEAGPDGEAVVCAEIDPARLAKVRRELPALGHRRRDVLG
jgi:deaminated glutathione amidase